MFSSPIGRFPPLCDLDQIEQRVEKQLHTFPALSRDIFQSFDSLLPRRNPEDTVSSAARKFNAPILDHVMRSEDYPTLKSVCEGRELPAYKAAVEFISKTAGNRDVISALVAQAVRLAAEKAEEVRSMIGAWSDDPGKPEKNEVNEELLAKVRGSDVPKNAAKYLGRFREIFAQGTYDTLWYQKGERPGTYKKNDYVTGPQEAGALPEDVPEELNELLSEWKDVKPEQALTAAAYFHAKLENIHPFADGNGRTGRLLMNYLLLLWDHPPSSFMKRTGKRITPRWSNLTGSRSWTA